MKIKTGIKAGQGSAIDPNGRGAGIDPNGGKNP